MELKYKDTTISRITDKILPAAREWQQRPLGAIYAVVFLDAIHYHVRRPNFFSSKCEPTSICYDYMGERSNAFRKAW